MKKLILCLTLVAAGLTHAEDGQAKFKAALEQVHKEYPIESKDRRVFFEEFQEAMDKAIKEEAVGLGKPERVAEIAAVVDRQVSWNEHVMLLETKYPDLKNDASHFSVLFDAAFSKEVERIGADTIKAGMLMPMADAVQAQIQEDEAKVINKAEEDAAFVKQFDREWAAKQRNKAHAQQQEQAIQASEQQRANWELTRKQVFEEQAQAEQQEAMRRNAEGIRAQAEAQNAAIAEANRAAQEQQEAMAWQLEQQRREMMRMQQEMEMQRREQYRRQAEERQRQQQRQIDEINRRNRTW